MGSEPRVMFDLNELPEDESFGAPDVEVQDALPTKQCISHALVPNKGSEAELAMEDSIVDMSQCTMVATQKPEPSDIQLGHHFSCFHSSVRPITKTPPLDEFGLLKTVRVESPSLKHAPNLNGGSHQMDCKGSISVPKLEPIPSGTAKPITSENLRGLVHGNTLKGEQKLDNTEVAKVGKEGTCFETVSAEIAMEVKRAGNILAAPDNKVSACFGKSERSDSKDARLGKKRNRQTMFLDVREAAKQTPPLKTPSSKKKLLPTTSFSKPLGILVDPRCKDFKTGSPVREGVKASALPNLSEFKPANLTKYDGAHVGDPDGLMQSHLSAQSVPHSLKSSTEGNMTSMKNKLATKSKAKGHAEL